MTCSPPWPLPDPAAITQLQSPRVRTALDGTYPALVGAVANVAVHPYALSQSQVTAHYALR